MELLLIMLFGGRLIFRLKEADDQPFNFENAFPSELMFWFAAVLGAVEYGAKNYATEASLLAACVLALSP
jgi:hypothetical protein